MDYTAKVPTIVNHTFSAINTWEKLVDGNTSLRKWRLKTRENDNIDTAFDYAYTSAPTEYMTNAGTGVNFDGCAMPTIYVRTAVLTNIVELEFWG